MTGFRVCPHTWGLRGQRIALLPKFRAPGQLQIWTSAESWSPANLVLRIQGSQPACPALSVLPGTMWSSHSGDANALMLWAEISCPCFQDPRWQLLCAFTQRQTCFLSELSLSLLHSHTLCVFRMSPSQVMLQPASDDPCPPIHNFLSLIQNASDSYLPSPQSPILYDFKKLLHLRRKLLIMW